MAEPTAPAPEASGKKPGHTGMVTQILARADNLAAVKPSSRELVPPQNLKDDIKKTEALEAELQELEERRGAPMALRDELNEAEDQMDGISTSWIECKFQLKEYEGELEEYTTRLKLACDEAEQCRKKIPILEIQIERHTEDSLEYARQYASAKKSVDAKMALIRESDENLKNIMSAGLVAATDSRVGLLDKKGKDGAIGGGESSERVKFSKERWAVQGQVLKDGGKRGTAKLRTLVRSGLIAPSIPQQNHQQGEGDPTLGTSTDAGGGLTQVDAPRAISGLAPIKVGQTQADYYWTFLVRAIRRGDLEWACGEHAEGGGDDDDADGASREGLHASLRSGTTAPTSPTGANNPERVIVNQQMQINDLQTNVATLQKQVQFRKRRFFEGEIELGSLRDRYDKLRIELTALRTVLTELTDGDTVEDLQADIRFYKKERYSLYHRLWNHHDFTMPPVERMYVDENNQKVERKKGGLASLTMKLMDQQEKSNEQPDGRGYQMRVIERQKKSMSAQREKLEKADMYIDKLHKKIEFLEEYSMASQDSQLNGRASQEEEIQRIVIEAKRMQERLVNKTAQDRQRFAEDRKELENEIDELRLEVSSKENAITGMKSEVETYMQEKMKVKEELHEVERKLEQANTSMGYEDMALFDLFFETLRQSNPEQYVGEEVDSSIVRIHPAAQKPATSFIETMYEAQHSALQSLGIVLKGIFKDCVRKNGGAATSLIIVNDKLHGLLNLNKKMCRRVAGCCSDVVHGLIGNVEGPEYETAGVQTTGKFIEEPPEKPKTVVFMKFQQTDLTLVGRRYAGTAVQATPERPSTTGVNTDITGGEQYVAGETAKRREGALKGQLELARQELTDAAKQRKAAHQEYHRQVGERRFVEQVRMAAEDRMSFAQQVFDGAVARRVGVTHVALQCTAEMEDVATQCKKSSGGSRERSSSGVSSQKRRGTLQRLRSDASGRSIKSTRSSNPPSPSPSESLTSMPSEQFEPFETMAMDHSTTRTPPKTLDDGGGGEGSYFLSRGADPSLTDAPYGPVSPLSPGDNNAMPSSTDNVIVDVEANMSGSSQSIPAGPATDAKKGGAGGASGSFSSKSGPGSASAAPGNSNNRTSGSGKAGSNVGGSPTSADFVSEASVGRAASRGGSRQGDPLGTLLAQSSSPLKRRVNSQGMISTAVQTIRPLTVAVQTETGTSVPDQQLAGSIENESHNPAGSLVLAATGGAQSTTNSKLSAEDGAAGGCSPLARTASPSGPDGSWRPSRDGAEESLPPMDTTLTLASPTRSHVVVASSACQTAIQDTRVRLMQDGFEQHFLANTSGGNRAATAAAAGGSSGLKPWSANPLDFGDPMVVSTTEGTREGSSQVRAGGWSPSNSKPGTPTGASQTPGDSRTPTWLERKGSKGSLTAGVVASGDATSPSGPQMFGSQAGSFNAPPGVVSPSSMIRHGSNVDMKEFANLTRQLTAAREEVVSLRETLESIEDVRRVEKGQEDELSKTLHATRTAGQDIQNQLDQSVAMNEALQLALRSGERMTDQQLAEMRWTNTEAHKNHSIMESKKTYELEDANAFLKIEVEKYKNQVHRLKLQLAHGGAHVGGGTGAGGPAGDGDKLGLYVNKDRESSETTQYITKLKADATLARDQVMRYKLEHNSLNLALDAKTKEVDRAKNVGERKCESLQVVIADTMKEKEKVKKENESLKHRLHELEAMATDLDGGSAMGVKNREEKKQDAIQKSKDLAAERKRVMNLNVETGNLKKVANRLIEKQKQDHQEKQERERIFTATTGMLQQKEKFAQARVLRVHQFIMEMATLIRTALHLPMVFQEPKDIATAKHFFDNDGFINYSPDELKKINAIVLEVAASDVTLLKKITDTITKWSSKRSKKLRGGVELSVTGEGTEDGDDDSDDDVGEGRRNVEASRRKFRGGNFGMMAGGDETLDPMARRRERLGTAAGGSGDDSGGSRPHTPMTQAEVDARRKNRSPSRRGSIPGLDTEAGGGPLPDINRVLSGDGEEALMDPYHTGRPTTPNGTHVIITPTRRVPSPSKQEARQEMKKQQQRALDSATPTAFAEFLKVQGGDKKLDDGGNHGQHPDEIAEALASMPARPATTIPVSRSPAPDFSVRPSYGKRLTKLSKTVTESLPKRVGSSQGPLAGRHRRIIQDRAMTPGNPQGGRSLVPLSQFNIATPGGVVKKEP